MPTPAPTSTTTISTSMNASIPYNLTVDGEPAWGGHFSAAGWQQVTADLTSYVGQTIQLRFGFRSDGTVTDPGVCIGAS